MEKQGHQIWYEELGCIAPVQVDASALPYATLMSRTCCTEGAAGCTGLSAATGEAVLRLPHPPLHAVAVLPSQVFMGINFYGYSYIKPLSASKSSRPADVQAVMGKAFLQALGKHEPKLVWQEKHAEHRVRYKVNVPQSMEQHFLCCVAACWQCSM